MIENRQYKYFLLLMTLHTAVLISSNAAGAKLIALPLGLTASATVMAYMLSFIILDTIAELYGKSYSKFVINIGLLAVALSVAFFELSIYLPPAEVWKNQEAFQAVLGSSWRILLGGWTAYLVSQHLDVWTFFKIRNTPFGGRHLWFRVWASILIGQLIDTVIFMVVAFGGVFPLIPAIIGQYLVKLAIVTIATPLVSVGVYLGRKHFFPAQTHK